MPKVIDLPTATEIQDDDYYIMEENGGGTKKIQKASTFDSMVVNAFKLNASVDTVIDNTEEKTVYGMSTRSYRPGTYIVLFTVNPLTVNTGANAFGAYLYLGDTLVASSSGTAQVSLSGIYLMMFRFTLSQATSGALTVKMRSGNASKTITIPSYADCVLAAWML